MMVWAKDSKIYEGPWENDVPHVKFLFYNLKGKGLMTTQGTKK